MFEKDGALYVRIFNAQGNGAPHPLAIGFESKKVELVELDGRVVQELEVTRSAASRGTVTLKMPRFGIRTLRFTGIKHAETKP